jgi:hypothetical protein
VNKYVIQRSFKLLTESEIDYDVMFPKMLSEIALRRRVVCSWCPLDDEGEQSSLNEKGAISD